MKSQQLPFCFIWITVFCCFCVLSANADCSVNEMGKIENCFNDDFFDKLHISPGNFAQMGDLQEDQPILFCETFQSLTSCIGDDIIQNCFNKEDFMKISFVNNNLNIARLFVTYYFMENDFCDKTNKFYLHSKCYFSQDDVNECINAIGATSDPCELEEKTSDCKAKALCKKCGYEFGCFMKKYGRYDICISETVCSYCNNLAGDYNPIEGVSCNDISSPSNSRFFSFSQLFLICLFSFYSYLM